MWTEGLLRAGQTQLARPSPGPQEGAKVQGRSCFTGRQAAGAACPQVPAGVSEVHSEPACPTPDRTQLSSLPAKSVSTGNGNEANREPKHRSENAA